MKKLFILTLLLAAFAAKSSFAQDYYDHYLDGPNYAVDDLYLVGDVANHHYMDYESGGTIGGVIIDTMKISITAANSSGPGFYQGKTIYPNTSDATTVDMDIYDFDTTAWDVITGYWEIDFSDGTMEYYDMIWYNGDAPW